MPNCCIVCGNSKAKDPSIRLYRFPKQPVLRAKWVAGLQLTNNDIKCESRVCSRHFRDSNPKTIPSVHIGPEFAAPPQMETARGKRRATHDEKSVTKRVCLRAGTCTSSSSVDDSEHASITLSCRSSNSPSRASLLNPALNNRYLSALPPAVLLPNP